MHIVFVYYHCDKLINQHETDNQPCYGDYHILRQRPYHAEYAGVPCTGCLADFPGNRAYLVIDVCKLPLKTVFTAKLFLTGFFIDLFHPAIGQISDETVMYFDRLNFLTIYPVLVAH